MCIRIISAKENISNQHPSECPTPCYLLPRPTTLLDACCWIAAKMKFKILCCVAIPGFKIL